MVFHGHILSDISALDNGVARHDRYIHKFPQGAIQFCIDIPDHESTFREHPPKYDWMESVYRSQVEATPHDAREPKGNLVWTTTYKDANSMHNLVMGRSAIGIIHFFNQMVVDCYSKHQNQVELAIYGSDSWQLAKWSSDY